MHERPATRLGPLRIRTFRLFFLGQAASLVGDQLVPVALTFAVLGGLRAHTHGTAADVGRVLSAGTVPLVVLLLAGGVIADRMPRRALMLTADLVRAAAQGGTAALLLTGHATVVRLMLLAVVWGSGAAFFTPATTGLIAELVPAHLRQQANALRGLSISGANILGPALAGLLVATVGAGWAIAGDAISFVVSAVCLAALGAPATAQSAQTAQTAGAAQAAGAADRAGVGGSFLHELIVGWREFRSRTWLWSIVTQFAFWHLLLLAPVQVLGAVVATRHYGGARGWGIALAAVGAGAVVGGVLALHWRPRHPLAVAELMMLPSGLVAAALAVPVPLIAVVGAMALNGVGLALFGTFWETTMQQEVPPAVLSRVSAYDWFGSLAFLPIGYAVVGPLAGALGLRATLLVGAGFVGVSVLAVLAVQEVRALQPQPHAAASV